MHTPVYLALDIGEVRIGLAVGSITPFGRGTIAAADKNQAMRKIEAIIHADAVNHLIVGVPHVKSGEITPIETLAREWAQTMGETFNLPVALVDEAYSSVTAERQLRREGIDTQKEKQKIDERAAQLLLSQYLNEHDNEVDDLATA